MKRIFTVFSLSILFLAVPVFAQDTLIEDQDATPEVGVEEPVYSLPDIGNHVYRTAIQYLYDLEIIEGYPDGTFKPDVQINRAEFVKMIVNSHYDLTDSEQILNCFPDVADQWFAKFVCFAKENNIIDGYPDGYFKPEQNINFVESAKILVLTKEVSYSADNEKEWYYGYVKALEDYKYVPPSISSLDKLITRGELSEMLWRILEEKSDQETITVLPVIKTGPAGWNTYTEDGFSFDHPGWVGYERHGWMYLSDEMKNITGLDTKNYIVVDTYLTTYTVAGSTEGALATTVWFSHPLVSTEHMTVNGMPAMKREFRAYPGDVMNGRTVGFDEVLLVYTYLSGNQIKVMQFFNAHPPTQAEYIEIYEQIAETVRPA